jgi:hypothetical protein
MLDAFAYGRFDLGGRELDLRAGSMVVNWGESTFIQGGINSAINHFDVSALRVPGSELREAYLPQEMVKASFALRRTSPPRRSTCSDWDETRARAGRHYFAANDFAVRGGEPVFLGFGGFTRTRASISARWAGRSSRTSRAWPAWTDARGERQRPVRRGASSCSCRASATAPSSGCTT